MISDGSGRAPAAFAGDSAERQLQAAGLGLAHQKFLEQQRMRADALGVVVGAQREQFVAQRQQAARLQPDDRHAARGERRVGRDQPVQFGARLIDQAGRKERPPAAQRPCRDPRASEYGRGIRPRPARAARRRDFRAHRRD